MFLNGRLSSLTPEGRSYQPLAQTGGGGGGGGGHWCANIFLSSVPTPKREKREGQRYPCS